MRALAVIAIVCVGMVFAFSFSTAKAETIATEGFAVQAEAGVNVSDNLKEEGIAFYTDIDTSIYGEDVQVYTLVTPEKNLVDGDITSLKKETSVDLDGWRIKAVKLAGEGAVKTFMATITFEGLTEAQLAEAYATKLVARSYVEKEGEVIYAQDNFVATSIKDVAQANLAEAIISDAIVTEENVAKWVKYAGITDVKAYYETASEVEFIDQDLDGADVYTVDGVAFDKIGDIQNGKLSNVNLTEQATQLIIIKDGNAIVTNAIKVTQIIDSKEEFDVVLLDPPRKGCEQNSLDYAIKLSKKAIIYVSCNPSTLARDLSYLHKNGFKTKYIQPVDMFCHSYHIESIAFLEKV